MKQKLFTLFALLLLVCSGAWAQETLFYWQGVGASSSSNITSLNDATTGTISLGASSGSVGARKGANAPSSYSSDVPDDLKLSVSGSNTKANDISNSNTYIALTCKDAGNFQAGDIVYVCADYKGFNIYANSGMSTLVANTNLSSDGSSKACVLETVTLPNTFTSATTIYLKRAKGSNTMFTGIKVVRPAADTSSPSIDTDLSAAYTAHVGSELTLTVAASHADSYQWYMNEDGDTSAKEADKIAGATSTSYTYTPSATGTKNIYCVATNSNATGTKTATSTVATVTIGERIWIGMKMESDGTPATVDSKSCVATLSDPTTSGITNVTLGAATNGSLCSIWVDRNRTVKGTDGLYGCSDMPRKVDESSGSTAGSFADEKWIGYTLTIADNYKATLTNLRATMWSQNDLSWTWRIRVLNSNGTVLYTSDTQTNTKDGDIADLYVANPTGLTDLLQGTYTVQMQVDANSTGAKYFAIPYLTFDATVEEYVAPKHTVTTSVNNADYGSVTATAEYVEGTDAVITATPNAAYKFSSWTIDGTEDANTENPYTFSSIDDDHTIQAVFVARKTIDYTVSTTNNGTRTDNFGTEYADDNDEFVAPTNLYLSSDNQTLTGWNDGTETKAVGATFDLSGGNKTLSPVFTTNSGATFAATLEASKSDFNVTWNMGNNYADFNVENATAYYVQQASINGTPVDIPMYIDAATNYSTTGGKVYNVGDDRKTLAQTNKGTIFRVPVVDGSVVTIVGYTAYSTTTINGSTDFDKSTNDGKTGIYTYSGTTGTVDIVLGEDNQYTYSINVTYPAPTYTVTYSAGDGTGTVPTETSKNEDEEFTLAGLKDGSLVAPAGKYLAGWNDGTNDYTLGANYTMPDDDVTFTAQWATSAEANHYHYSYKDATHYTGDTTYKDPLGNTASIGTTSATENQTLADGNIISDHDGITSVAIANAVYDGKSDYPYMSAYLKLKKNDATSKVTITIADGYTATLTMKAGGYSKNPTISVSDATLMSGTVGGVATTEDNYNTLVYTLAAGSHEITCSSNNMYISEMDVTAEPIPTVAVTISAAEWASFSSTQILDFSNVEGLTAYKATETSSSSVHYEEVTTVPANTGLILNGAAGTYNVPVAASASEITDNLLVGTADAAYTTVAADANLVYAFGKLNNKIGFVKAETGYTVPQGKAYLRVTEALAAKGLSFIGLPGDEGETTNINLNVNDNLNFDQNAPRYNMSGQRVSDSYKGIVIVNGKKVVIK